MARSRGRPFLKLVIAGLLGFLLLAAVGILYAFRSFHAEGPLPESTVVLIEPGAGLERMAGQLAETGAVTSAPLFEWGVRLSGGDRALQAGEYRIPARASMAEIMTKLQAGDVVVHRLTVPEGTPSAEIVKMVNAAPALDGKIAEVPEEGVLLPETYHYTYGDSRTAIMDRMRAQMDAVVKKAWAQRAGDLPLQAPEEAVILASVIEKETAVAAERRLIAGVFVNRLRMDMPLQSDPTVIYGLTEGEDLDRALTKADLESDSAYNTYQRRGLPPTPITNPGRAAIMAAVNPLETDALYFVADGSGGHAFAATYEEHKKNVARWRKIRRQNEDIEESGE